MTRTTRGTSGRRGWCARVVWLALVAGCGGPAVPPSGPAGTPLAVDAESAPLPAIGSSFEEPAETETETEVDAATPTGHGGHGAHAH